MTWSKKKFKLAAMATMCLLLAEAASAQTWDEWFEQKKTQIAYLEKQIAELQIYIVDLEKGYQVVQKGLQVIHDIKQGDFNLHSAYFASLSSVNPAVGNSSTVTGCQSLISQISTQVQQLSAKVNSSPVFTAADKGYVAQVLQSLQTKAQANAGSLTKLASGTGFSLQDQQRQARIDAIHTDLQSQYSFVQHFSAEVSLMGAQRQQISVDAQSIQQIYSLP
jgi:outer membrane murein-binding lipoprotein Lpp